ncbi:MAG: hypothetical protein M3336_17450 [Chloroflexota bacterium]|nr:hypothetical protein [Chloroflexota bacterium]
MTLATFLQPLWLVALLAWSFAVLSAAQLTIRLIMAFSVRQTLAGALVLTGLAIAIAAVFDALAGENPSLSRRLSLAPLTMLLMAVAGFVVARRVLRFRRLRGQVIAGVMVGVLDPHVFALLSS